MTVEFSLHRGRARAYVVHTCNIGNEEQKKKKRECGWSPGREEGARSS